VTDPDPNEVELDDRLASAIELPPRLSRQDLAAELARRAGRPAPKSEGAVAFWVSLAKCAEQLLLGDWRTTDRADAADGIAGCVFQRRYGNFDSDALRSELGLKDVDDFARGFAIGFLIEPIAGAGHYRLVGPPGSPVTPEQLLRDTVE
jgi:hypothetical protein